MDIDAAGSPAGRLRPWRLRTAVTSDPTIVPLPFTSLKMV
jgi:hypothetical protein